MKRTLIFLFVIFIIPGYLKAQTFPLNKTKEEIREFRRTGVHSAKILALSDTCDVYEIGSLIHENYFYHDGICYKTNQIYYLDTNEVMSDAISIEQSIFNHYDLKKVGDNIWLTPNGNEQIELIVKDKNQYIIQMRLVSNKN